MQTEEIRHLLEQALGVISQKACGSINRTTKKALEDSGMSLEDIDLGNGGPGASRGRGVSVLQYPGWAQTLIEWPDHASFGCPVGE